MERLAASQVAPFGLESDVVMASRDVEEQRAARELAASYSNYGEGVLAAARLCFRVALTVRFFLLPGPWPTGTSARLTLQIASLTVTTLFSLWAALRARRRAFGPASHVISAIGDIALCTVSLSSTMLWPEVGYTGLLSKPDVAFLCVLVFAGALRLEKTAIVASTVASLLAFVTLVGWDLRLNAPRAVYRAQDLQMTAILIGVAGAAAWFSALAVQRALARVAREATTRSRAENHLREVLRDHHDVRTQLSSARLHLDLLLCEPLSEPLRGHAAAAASAIADIAGVAEGIRRRTYSELCANEELTSVELEPLLRDTIASVATRFPAVTLRCTPAPRLAVALFGGGRGLVHVMANLLVNACEGNGRQSATAVELRAALDPARPGFVRVEINDDGPGFSDEMLRGGARQGLSTKAEGAGLGLGLVQGLVEASGGELRLGNRSTGGAQVSLWFRSARGTKPKPAPASLHLPLG